MRTALIITTVNIPTVLALYRKLDPGMRFFVALEIEKTTAEQRQFLNTIPNLFMVWEGSPKWKCSDLIGWRTIARRNIALLEALEWGADVIVSIDDDNIPVDQDYFLHFESLLAEGERWDGIKARPLRGWLDPASLAFPPVVQRGFPQTEISRAFYPRFEPVTGTKIGIAQGMILGDPDTSAVDRISQHPEVHQVSELLRAGIVTDPRECYAPLNSQNIAFVRDLAPCFLMVPAFKRYDDIYASLVAQRVMRERGLCVHYGQPFVWQTRNAHNLLRDLSDEQWGAEHILEFAAWLDAFLGQTDVIGFLKVMATNLPKFVPSGTQDLWLAWLEDCERVMK